MSRTGIFQQGATHICNQIKKVNAGRRADVSIGTEENEFVVVLCQYFLWVVRLCVRGWVWLIKKISRDVFMDESCDVNEVVSQINE